MKNSHDMDKHIDVMQENMLKMHKQMHKTMDAENPQERERLMQAHREIMQHHMQFMKDGGVISQGMMGDDAKSGAGAGQKQKDSEKH